MVVVGRRKVSGPVQDGREQPTSARFADPVSGPPVVGQRAAGMVEGAGGVAVEAIDRIAIRLAEFTRAR